MHRSTLYPATPTLSVEAVQERLICVAEIAAATKLPGTVGGVVSGAGEEEELPEPPHPLNSKVQVAAKTIQRRRFAGARFAISLFILNSKSKSTHAKIRWCSPGKAGSRAPHSETYHACFAAGTLREDRSNTELLDRSGDRSTEQASICNRPFTRFSTTISGRTTAPAPRLSPAAVMASHSVVQPRAAWAPSMPKPARLPLAREISAPGALALA